MFYNISYAIHEPAIHAGWFALPGIRFDNNVVKPAYLCFHTTVLKG